LSGGQQQRLVIARAIAVQPEVLLMDEPTSAIDRCDAKIEELVEQLKEQYTIVIVTHNMQQAARISDYTAFFYEGEIVEFGPTRQSLPSRPRSRPKITSPVASVEPAEKTMGFRLQRQIEKLKEDILTPRPPPSRNNCLQIRARDRKSRRRPGAAGDRRRHENRPDGSRLRRGMPENSRPLSTGGDRSALLHRRVEDNKTNWSASAIWPPTLRGAPAFSASSKMWKFRTCTKRWRLNPAPCVHEASMRWSSSTSSWPIKVCATDDEVDALHKNNYQLVHQGIERNPQRLDFYLNLILTSTTWSALPIRRQHRRGCHLPHSRGDSSPQS
jgi:hypothetical protein